ncbi:MAG: hypothetical protein ACI8XO_001705 [Verrucomicrobiales bacterium]|jgi:hypothetical protein
MRTLNIILLATVSASSSLWAQEGSSDATGTNPINFTNDLRIYNEYQWLKPGDAGLNLTTLEYRTPFADGKWSFRTRVKATALDVGDVNEFGFGDMDFRFLTVPYLNMDKKMAIATGIEFSLPTASDDLLGSNAITAGPQVFGVFFKPFGGFFDLIAPAYQHKFSIYEDDDAPQVHQGLFDLFLLKTSADKSKWALINPQAVLDYENDKQFALLEAEIGTMIGTGGKSVYLRPSYGIGDDRPYDFSLEAGFKLIW